MPFAVLEPELTFPPADKLARALKHLARFSALDAPAMARDCYGIIAQGLEADEARTLAGRLATEGIAAIVVDERKLMPVPPPRRICRAGCTGDGVELRDQLGRTTVIGWPQVFLVAAGRLPLDEEIREERSRWIHVGEGVEVVTDVTRRLDTIDHFILDLIFAVEPGHVRIKADEFVPLASSGVAAVQPHQFEMFIGFIHALVGHAPAALLNRGARMLQEEPFQITAYPSRHAFEEEMTWLLWKRLHGVKGNA